MEEPLPLFITVSMIFAITVMILLFFSGKYLEFKIIEEDYIEYTKAIDMLSAITTSSSIVEKNTENLPMKLILDKNTIITKENIIPQKEIDDFSYLDYDYSIEITDFKTGEVWNLGFEKDVLNRFVKNGKRCLDLSEKPLSSVSIPAIIKKDDSRNAGQIKIWLTSTPLSKLTYFTSIACSTEGFEKNVWLYEIEDVKFDDSNDEICVKPKNSDELCKKIKCDLGVETQSCGDSCKTIKDSIGCHKSIIKNTGERVIIYVPQLP